MQSRPSVELSIKDAKERDIKDGDLVRLYYDNGRKLLTSSHGIIVEDENPYIVIKDSDTSSGNGVVGWIEAQNSSG